MKRIFLVCMLVQLSVMAQKKRGVKEGELGQDPLNVILMIGDGMGVPQISTAFYFGDSVPNFQQFNNIGFIKTSSKSHTITDSAGGATAFATGEKSYNRGISVSTDTIAKETILEHLQTQGYQTGLISLTSITHATPACFYAHVKDRDMHEEIAEQLLTANVDFLAGGGKKYFRSRQDDKDLLAQFKAKGYHVDTVGLSTPVPNKRNFFIPTEEGLPAKIAGRGDFLSEASSNAFTYFGAKKAPFFLMIEGSYIDWGGHAENGEMVVSEVQDFDKTLGVVMAYVKTHPNTLLVVTADHETGGVSVGKFYETDGATQKKTEVPGKVGVYFNTDQHSGELIPVFAMGTNADGFRGIYENNEIYHKIRAAIETAGAVKR